MLQQSKKRTLCVEIALIEIYVFTDIGSGKYTHTQHDSVEVRLGPVFISQQQVRMYATHFTYYKKCAREFHQILYDIITSQIKGGGVPRLFRITVLTLLGGVTSNNNDTTIQHSVKALPQNELIIVNLADFLQKPPQKMTP